jgi:hypothetical protein
MRAWHVHVHVTPTTGMAPVGWISKFGRSEAEVLFSRFTWLPWVLRRTNNDPGKQEVSLHFVFMNKVASDRVLPKQQPEAKASKPKASASKPTASASKPKATPGGVAAQAASASKPEAKASKESKGVAPQAAKVSKGAAVAKKPATPATPAKASGAGVQKPQTQAAKTPSQTKTQTAPVPPSFIPSRNPSVYLKKGMAFLDGPQGRGYYTFIPSDTPTNQYKSSWKTSKRGECMEFRDRGPRMPHGKGYYARDYPPRQYPCCVCM